MLRAARQTLDLMRLSILERDDAVIEDEPAFGAPTIDFTGHT
jgi:hypothetical protein